MMSAIEECLPNTQVHGCSFHFGQALLRRINENGLKTLYETNSQFHTKFRVFFAFQYLEVKNVRRTFVDHIQNGFWNSFGELQLNSQQYAGVQNVSFQAFKWLEIDKIILFSSCAKILVRL